MKYCRQLFILVAFCWLFCTGFSWSLLFGELRWQEVEAEITRKYPEVASITAAELKGRLGDPDLVLVDVREPEEYRVSRIPGAILPDRVDRDSLPEDTVIVAYCSVGLRSAAYAQELRNRGFERIFNLTGSIFQWGNSGYPLVSEDGPVRMIHPYNRRWGRLLNEDLHSYSPNR